jgi:hypothetical protein
VREIFLQMKSEFMEQAVLLQDEQGRYWLQTVRNGVCRSSYIGPLAEVSVKEFAARHGLEVIGRPRRRNPSDRAGH